MSTTLRNIEPKTRFVLKRTGKKYCYWGHRANHYRANVESDDGVHTTINLQSHVKPILRVRVTDEGRTLPV